MASDLSFVEYILDQIKGSEQVSFKKMFGEYAIYYDNKVVALVCDNQLFVKPTIGGRTMIGDIVEAPPYSGAKPYFLIGEQLENQQWMLRLIQLTASELPPPKPKAVKQKSKKISRYRDSTR
jgi:DNA transformation protein and related proteins